MKKFSWKSSVFGNANAQLVGEELEELEKSTEITNKSVLDYAKNHKKSEIYKCFDWDDKVAGEKWRLTQANQIIGSISFVIEEEPVKKQKIYYSVKSDKEENRKFKNIVDILDNDDDYKALLDKAKREFETCRDNYNDLIKREDLKDIIFEIYREI